MKLIIAQSEKVQRLVMSPLLSVRPRNNIFKEMERTEFSTSVTLQHIAIMNFLFLIHLYIFWESDDMSNEL